MKELKPFNLQDALTGKAVMLCDGTKAYVRHHETKVVTDIDKVLFGYSNDGVILTWSVSGQYLAGLKSPKDILGMYPETRIINGFEVPAPETEAPEDGDRYYAADIGSRRFYEVYTWEGDNIDFRVLKRGLVFLRKVDAIATAKAMLGIDPQLKPYETRVIQEACMTKAGLQIRFKQ